MFLPPIMGAGGFLMAELTETSYTYIMMIAVFPALLYFFSVFCMIHFEANRITSYNVCYTKLLRGRCQERQFFHTPTP